LRDLKRKWQVTLTAGLGLMVLMYLPLNLDTMDRLMPAIFVRLVEDAQGAKPPMQRLADTVSAWFVPGVLIAAAVTFAVWAGGAEPV